MDWTIEFFCDYKMLFGKKLCPRCGKKMKLIVFKMPLTEEEQEEYRKPNASFSGGVFSFNCTIGTPENLYKKSLVLRCFNCHLTLHSNEYRRVRKEQKRTKKHIIDEGRLIDLLNGIE